MCGIAGFVTTGFRGDSRDVVHRMVTALRHRGPDDQGEYVDAQVALGSCRLSIIDLPGGRQPIGNENGTVRSEEHTSELQSLAYLVCRLLLEKKKSSLPPNFRAIAIADSRLVKTLI